MFVTRAFNPATDFPALIELLNTVAKADVGSAITEAEHRGFVESFEKYGPFRQWIIPNPENSKSFIAYAWLHHHLITPYAEFVIAVHPNFREKGLDTKLLDALKQAAKERRVDYISAFVLSDSYVQKVLLEHKFKGNGAFRLLSLDIAQPFPMPEIPSKFMLRTYDQVNNINVLTEIANTGLADLPGHKVATIELMKDILKTNPDDATYMLFDSSSRIIGSVGVRLQGEEGTVDSPAIIQEYRSPELYKTLVLLGLHDLMKRGCKQVQMYSWGDYDSTIAAYTELGFKTVVHELGYRLDLV